MKVPTVHLENVHFAQRDRVKFRKHITVGVAVATVLGIVGTAYGVPWCLHVSLAMQAGTSVLWIWE